MRGLGFPESPRWHDDRLYLSDMGARSVVAIDVASGGVTEVVGRVPGAPSGLAWDDDGRLLIVSMARSAVFRDDGGDRLTTFADLSGFRGGWRNDCVRHPAGWLYVGAVGDGGPADGGIADLVVVDVDGRARLAAEGLDGPNGMVITDDGSTLIVDEYGAGRMMAFTIDGDGSLSDPRPFAAFPNWSPDGCCIDAEDAVWVASAGSPEVRRIAGGGRVLDTVTASQGAFACMLGGPDRRTLFVCTAPGADDDSRAAWAGCIEAFPVSVPGAGSP